MFSGPIVVPVGKQVEHDGIVVTVEEVVLSGEGTTLKFRLDCGPHEPLESLGSPELVVDGSTILHGGGGGGNMCDTSEVKEFWFPTIPPDARDLYFQYGPFMGWDAGEMVLEIPIGGYLSTLDPTSGGKVAMDAVVESQGRAYRFTELSAGVRSFSLKYEPANEETRWLPLTGPTTDLVVEDDRGHEFTMQGSGGSFNKEAGYAIRWGDFDFSGRIDMSGSVLKLRATNPGKVYRGPWEFRIELPYPRDVVITTATPTPTNTPTPTRSPVTPTSETVEPPIVHGGPRLAQALGMIPMEYADRVVGFDDYAASMASLGLEWVHSVDDLSRIDRDIVARLYEGLSMLPAGLDSYSGTLNEKVGLDFGAFDMGVWAVLNPAKTHYATALQGVFDRDLIAQNLLALEYKREEHNGTPYFWLNEDFKVSIKHPLRLIGLYLNRVALIGDRVLASPATGPIASMIDAQYGRTSNLMDSRAHRALVEAVGEGLIGAVIMPSGWIIDTWEQVDEENVERPDAYLEGPDQWGTLSPYEQALMGYRIRDVEEETVVALYYPDPAAAAKDSGELGKRWRTFRFETGASGYEDVVSVGDICSPLTIETIALADASLSIATCPVTRPDDRRPHVWEGPNLWVQLFTMRQMHFLAPDLEKLKEIGTRE
jgi:hypothetical protein